MLNSKLERLCLYAFMIFAAIGVYDSVKAILFIRPEYWRKARVVRLERIRLYYRSIFQEFYAVDSKNWGYHLLLKNVPMKLVNYAMKYPHSTCTITGDLKITKDNRPVLLVKHVIKYSI